MCGLHDFGCEQEGGEYGRHRHEAEGEIEEVDYVVHRDQGGNHDGYEVEADEGNAGPRAKEKAAAQLTQ